MNRKINFSGYPVDKMYYRAGYFYKKGDESLAMVYMANAWVASEVPNEHLDDEYKGFIRNPGFTPLMNKDDEFDSAAQRYEIGGKSQQFQLGFDRGFKEAMKVAEQRLGLRFQINEPLEESTS